MKVKLIILIGNVIMCITFTGCKTQSQNRYEVNTTNNEQDKESEINEETDTTNELDKENKTNKEDLPVMSEESLECIKTALGENSKHGVGIAEFIADVTSEKIVEAEMIEDSNWYGYVMQVKDSSDNIYMVFLNALYSVQAIKKDSLDGDVVFYVTE